MAAAAAIEAQIEPTDSCVLFNASNLQCLRCRTTCPSACVNAVRSQGAYRGIHGRIWQRPNASAAGSVAFQVAQTRDASSVSLSRMQHGEAVMRHVDSTSRRQSKACWTACEQIIAVIELWSFYIVAWPLKQLSDLHMMPSGC